MFRMRATVSSTHGIWVKFPASLCSLKFRLFVLCRKHIRHIEIFCSSCVSQQTNLNLFLSPQALVSFSLLNFHMLDFIIVATYVSNFGRRISRRLYAIEERRIWVLNNNLRTNKEKKPFENSSVNHNFFATLSSLTHLQFSFRLEVNRHKNSGQNQKPLNNCLKFVLWQIASLTDLRTLQTKQK